MCKEIQVVPDSLEKRFHLNRIQKEEGPRINAGQTFVYLAKIKKLGSKIQRLNGPRFYSIKEILSTIKYLEDGIEGCLDQDICINVQEFLIFLDFRIIKDEQSCTGSLKDCTEI